MSSSLNGMSTLTKTTNHKNCSDLIAWHPTTYNCRLPGSSEEQGADTGFFRGGPRIGRLPQKNLCIGEFAKYFWPPKAPLWKNATGGARARFNFLHTIQLLRWFYVFQTCFFFWLFWQLNSYTEPPSPNLVPYLELKGRGLAPGPPLNPPLLKKYGPRLFEAGVTNYTVLYIDKVNIDGGTVQCDEIRWEQLENWHFSRGSNFWTNDFT